MNLVINSKFRPFTYDELIKPFLQYKEEYDRIEQDYSDLAAQAEVWKDIASRENSPEAYEMYQRYSNDLSRYVDDFSKGMNPTNRRGLLNMKRRYAQDIAPIARASEAMKEANDLRAKASPDAIFEIGEYNSLDQFLHGKTANNKYQSREALIKQTAAITEATMAEAMKDPEFKKVMGDQYWEIVQHTGGSYKDLSEAIKLGIMDNPIAQNRFSQIRQEVARKAGIEKYDAAGQRAIMNAIDLGLYSGLDKPTIQFQANQGYLNPLQQESLRQARAASSGGGGGGRGRKRGVGTSSSRESSSGDEYDEDAYVANDAIFEDLGNGKYASPIDMKPSDIHGLQTTWEELRQYPRLRKAVERHLDGSDPRQYEFYTWRSSKTGRNRVQIKRKQSYTKPGPSNPSLRDNPEDLYLFRSNEQ